ncbi:hypothetical protein B0H16DRAFT_437000 [Mycena metata]|uniref:DUF6533 domain-containing protein n=1 Tax=Mycena metata TaxID=1033252 RepID=A0AAD7HCI9_9AGAR|nr:hypothetical protein B0H16DRAFT_437000 [Mycena metata]
MGSLSAASYVSDLQLVAYVDVACLTVLTYDTFLNAGQEYQHIWKTKWGLINCLYLWTRYGAFVDTTLSVLKSIDPNLGAPCTGISKFNELFSGFGVGIAEVILMIRTYTLYERSKKLLGFFLAMFLASGGITAWDVTHWTADTQPVALVSCNLTSSSDITLVCYYILLATETITVLLTLWKGFHTFALTRSLGLDRPSNLMLSFYRDGIMFLHDYAFNSARFRFVSDRRTDFQSA